ncbi:MAG: LLM class flavin-dependent oxidoreductase, partial [Mycobacteriaceae bacterium]
MSRLRFCAYQYQHLPLDSLTERWREAERLGFDVLWNCDTLVEPDRPRHIMFDGPATLTLMAERTRTIRIGTLVTSLYFRHPATFAKSVTTIDHLSAGRLEIALGVGDPSAGPAAIGIQWSTAERVARFAEFVRVIDQLLTHETSDFNGTYFTCTGAETIPLPVQQPRPPLTI